MKSLLCPQRGLQSSCLGGMEAAVGRALQPLCRASPGAHPWGGGPGDSGTSSLFFWLFSQLIVWHLLPRDVEHGCQDCTLLWREGKGLEGAQQPRSHLTPVVRPHQQWGTGCCPRDTLEIEGPRLFLILLLSSCMWEVFNLERPALLYHIPVGLCWFITSEILV